jgi:hypothetical protein
MLMPSEIRAQGDAKPSPEMEYLKSLEGAWEATMAGGAGKGTMTYKMELGGNWLVGDFQGEFGGMKFSGRGLDSYDPNKKKFVGIWVDSMSHSPMVSEGTYDAAKKTMTMTGEGPDQTGKNTKYRMTTQAKDKDNMVWTMYMVGPDGKDAEAMSITYKRKK